MPQSLQRFLVTFSAGLSYRTNVGCANLMSSRDLRARKMFYVEHFVEQVVEQEMFYVEHFLDINEKRPKTYAGAPSLAGNVVKYCAMLRNFL